MNSFNRDDLSPLKNAGVLSSLDVHFSRFMERLNGKASHELRLAAALLSSLTGRGHICLDLSMPLELILGDGVKTERETVFPAAKDWREALQASSVVGSPGQYRPLILDSADRLYLYRYWEYERRLVQGILERITRPFPLDDGKGNDLKGLLNALFPPEKDDSEPDWQKIAAFTAATRRFCVISGGPGTGKTTTVARILFLLAALAHPRPMRAALAAPTGKAAARLQESVGEALKHMPWEKDGQKSIPQKATTLHRLLGSHLHSPYFRHHAENPLPLDLVVVDEASMVDLPLMSKLVQALPSHARLILLGDKDQLASVEAGAVLGDICDSGEPLVHSGNFIREVEDFCGPVYSRGDEMPLKGRAGSRGKRKPKDGVIQLKRSYRFHREMGIAGLSRCVRHRHGKEAMAILRAGDHRDVKWLNPRESPLGFQPHLKNMVEDGYGHYFQEVKRLLRRTPSPGKEELRALFDSMGRFRILCALREGPWGIKSLNERVEGFLGERGWADASRNWYAGKPVMIRRNDYQLGLFNGDTGICLPDVWTDNELRVFFPWEKGGFRAHHLLRLPEHETVYAMTVHMSQGSEFDRVFLVLPDRDSPVLTRELIYTGITRARETVVLWTGEEVFLRSVSRETRRLSGLADALWKEHP